MRAPIIISLCLVLAGTASSIAQTNCDGTRHDGTRHAGHVPGMKHGSQTASQDTSVMLTEPGQGAFAALSEVVRVLEADPATDWSKVDLAGLRNHLRDMDRLVSDAVVTTDDLRNGLRMSVTGDAATIDTARRMVPAHAAELAKETRWTVTAERTDDGAILTVTSDDPATVARIRGLGFFGLMASQDHHREHHMMMARGLEAHAH